MNYFKTKQNLFLQLDTFWLDDTYRGSVINIYARSVGGFPLAFFYGKQKTEKIKNQFITIHGENNFEQTRKSVRNN